MRPALVVGSFGAITLAIAVWVAYDMSRPKDAASYTPRESANSIAVTTVAADGNPATLRVEQVGKKDTAAAVTRIEAFEKRWQDAIALAESTPRIQLAAPVKDLQALAREAGSLELTPCLEPGRPALVENLEAQVAFFLAFMAREEWRHADLVAKAAREGRNWQMVKDACRGW